MAKAEKAAISPQRRKAEETQRRDAQETGAISTATAAKLLMISDRFLFRLVEQGWISKTETGKYTVVAVVQGYIKYLRDEQRRASKSEAQGKLVDARSTYIEVQTLERTGELTRRARMEALSVIDEGFGALKANLLAVPARCTMQLDLRQKIEAEIEDALGQTARWAEDQRRSLEADGSADAADTEDGNRDVGEGEPEV